MILIKSMIAMMKTDDVDALDEDIDDNDHDDNGNDDVILVTFVVIVMINDHDNDCLC